MWDVLTAMWWIYVIIMIVPLMFTGGIEHFFVGLLTLISVSYTHLTLPTNREV